GARLGGDGLLVHETAPGDVTGIARLDPRRQQAAHARANAVGADQHLAACARAIGKYGGHIAALLLDALERHAGAIAFARQQIGERAVDARPGSHDLRHRDLVADAAV